MAQRVKEEEFLKQCTFAPDVAKSKKSANLIKSNKQNLPNGRTSTGSINLAPIMKKKPTDQYRMQNEDDDDEAFKNDYLNPTKEGSDAPKYAQLYKLHKR